MISPTRHTHTRGIHYFSRHIAFRFSRIAFPRDKKKMCTLSILARVKVPRPKIVLNTIYIKDGKNRESEQRKKNETLGR